MRVIITFSGRETGNCQKIAQYIADNVGGKVIRFSGIIPCGNCQYECFKLDMACQSSDHKKVDEIYQDILSSDETIMIIPNYVDYPCSNLFIFSERGSGFFNKKAELVDTFMNIPKKFVVISNSNQDHFLEVFKYLALEPRILFISPKSYKNQSIDGNLLNNLDVQERIMKFITEEEK